MKQTAICLDDPEVAVEQSCQEERANWVAKRVGLPAVGATLRNKYGIEWVVQSQAAAPREESLQRWRSGDVQPHMDMYPVIVPTNFSPQLMEFFNAIDRCTLKSFAILDTMPGRRSDGHIPGGNYIDTICNPMTNLLYLDAVGVHETVVAHELGHAWVQYVDECEDYRTMEDASNPQRMRQVSFIQSYVLDLKVNDLLRRKGFDMSRIEEDQAMAVSQLAKALASGYSPEHLREEVFMALLVADQMVERDCGRTNELARFDHALTVIREKRPPLADLVERLAESVRKHGYQTKGGIIASIDECLLASFEHCGERIDLDRDLVSINPQEPNIDKFPAWLPPLSPKTKAIVGRHMARNDISSDWSQRLETAITGNARVCFMAPTGDQASRLQLSERIGPPNRYSDLPDEFAEMLAHKHLNELKVYLTNGGPPHKMSDLHKRSYLSVGTPSPTAQGLMAGPPGFLSRLPVAVQNPHLSPQPPQIDPIPGSRSPRPYMAGTGRFLTAARLQEQLEGEHPYAYALNNPVSYTDPSGLNPNAPPNVFCSCDPVRVHGIKKGRGKDVRYQCYLGACADYCTALDNAVSDARTTCEEGGILGAPGYNNSFRVCNAESEYWQECGLRITVPGGMAFNGAYANHSNYPYYKYQIAIAAPYCIVECTMRVCCATLQATDPKKNLKNALSRCRKKYG